MIQLFEDVTVTQTPYLVVGPGVESTGFKKYRGGGSKTVF